MVGIGLSCLPPMFLGKTKRPLLITKSQSLARFLPPEQDDFRSRALRKNRHLEEQDAKGGFSLWQRDATHGFKPKAITDLSMVSHLGVTPDITISSPDARKRHATVSVADPDAPQTLKRPKSIGLDGGTSFLHTTTRLSMKLLRMMKVCSLRWNFRTMRKLVQWMRLIQISFLQINGFAYLELLRA